MCYLLKDSISCFSSLEELCTYQSKINLNSKKKVSLPNMDETIGNIFCDTFSDFCNKLDFFKSYDKKCHEILNANEATKDSYFLDIFYTPFFVDIILSALYTAEYFKIHKYYIRIPELIHLGGSVTPFQLSKICDVSYTESTISDTRPNIILKPRKNDNQNNQYKALLNNEYKSAIDIFKGKKSSRFWIKLYNTSHQELQQISLQAIPLFMSDLSMDLLFRNDFSMGMKTSNVDVSTYFKQLQPMESLTNDLHTLLRQYKIECIFRPRLITEFTKALTTSEYYFENEDATEILIEILNCKFISPILLLPHIQYEISSDEVKPLNLLSSYSSYLFTLGNEYDYKELDFFPNHQIMHNYFTQLTNNIVEAKKDFFAKLCVQYKSFDIISEKLWTVLMDTCFLKKTMLEYDTFFLPKEGPETMLYKRQKDIAKEALKEYWNL
ncbi:MAG: hypothetical protein LBN31_01025 [Hungatella sp.]|nr:hypothetical protein [Hungatella sp.]